jgi:hypothetical protein
MADRIIDCVELRDQNDALIKYLVRYEIESGGDSTHIEVEVLSADLSNPADMNEVKSAANAKASSRKTTWVAALLSARVNVQNGSINGDVTL